MSNEKRSIAERSAETWAVVNLLKEVPELGIVSYEKLAQVIGNNPQEDGRHHVASACKILEREGGIIFDAVENVGLKRADDLLKVAIGRKRLRKTARAAKRTRRVLAAVEKWDALPEEKRREHNILAAQAGAIQAMAGMRAARALGGKMDEKRQQLDPSESLKLMKASL